MKLNEIIQTNIQQSRLGEPFNPQSSMGVIRNDRTRTKNAGAFYGMNDKNDDPHEIRKHTLYPTNIKTGIDAFAAYAKVLIENGMSGNNIYAPRIYNVKKSTDSTGEVHYDFDIEKLVASHQISNKDAVAALTPAFESLDMFTRIVSASKHTRNGGDITGRIGDLLTVMIRYDEIDTDSDDLNALLHVIQDVRETANKSTPRQTYGIDIGPSNIMYRRTSVGLQMVINDPLA